MVSAVALSGRGGEGELRGTASGEEEEEEKEKDDGGRPKEREGGQEGK